MPLTNSTQYVLVVEDDRSLRDLYRSALSATGHEVIAVEDGLDALRMVGNRYPGAIVLDMVLPGLNGREVYRELKSNPETSHIPVVLVTGGDMSDLPLDESACFILKKPTTIAQLLAAVDTVLGREARPASDP